MKQEKISVEIGKALPQLNQWRIKVWRFKEAAVSFIHRTKGMTKKYKTSFQWKYSGVEFNVVLFTMDKLVWRVFQMTCQTEVRKARCHYRNDTRRRIKINAPRNYHHFNPLGAFASASAAYA
jgi:hypothetical protein